MALGQAPNSTLQRHPMSKTVLQANQGKGVLWRPGAERYLFLVTDEDSDCPFYDVNRFFSGTTSQCTTPGFVKSDNDGTYEPTKTIASNAAWPDLPNPWQQDTVAAANAIVATQARVTLFVKPTNGRSNAQFGDPTNATQVQNADFSGFDRNATLAKQLAAFPRSLQAILLANSKAYPLRLFDTRAIVSPNVVDNVFTEIVNTLKSSCFGRRKRDIIGDPSYEFPLSRKRQTGCSVDFCDTSKVCRTIPSCDVTAMANGCDNCVIKPNATSPAVCVFDGQPNLENGCEVCSFYKSSSKWSYACDDRDDCTIDECVVDPFNGKKKCKHTDSCSPQVDPVIFLCYMMSLQCFFVCPFCKNKTRHL